MATDPNGLSPGLRALIALLLIGVVLVPIVWCTGLWGAGEISTELIEVQTEP